jgi:ABC-type Mn2+/Zn2+ transport system permease subunit
MDELILRALIAAFAVSLASSVAGSLTVIRGAPFLVAGSSHSALAGAALAVLLSSAGFPVDYFFVALVFAVISAILASYAARFGDINTGVAISFALSMSLATLFLSMTREYASKAWTLFFGDLFLLTEHDVFLLVSSTSIALLISSLFYHRFIFISFDPEGAEAFGVNVKLTDYLLLSLISLSIVSALKAIGAILVFAMFVAPAATAKEVAKNLSHIFYISFAIAFLALVSGILVSSVYPVPAGAFAALISSLIYFLTVLLWRLINPR